MASKEDVEKESSRKQLYMYNIHIPQSSFRSTLVAYFLRLLFSACAYNLREREVFGRRIGMATEAGLVSSYRSMGSEAELTRSTDPLVPKQGVLISAASPMLMMLA